MSFAQLPHESRSKRLLKMVPFWKRPWTNKALPRTETVENLKQELKMDEHTIPVEQLLTRLDVNLQTVSLPPRIYLFKNQIA